MAKAKKENTRATEKVFIAKTGKHDDAQYVAVNGKRMLVRKGEETALPSEFAEVIRTAQRARREADRFIESVSA